MPTAPVRRVVLAVIACASACGPKTASSTEGTGSASSTSESSESGPVTAGPAYVCEPAVVTGGTGETGEEGPCPEHPEFTASLAAWREAVATNMGCYHYSVIDQREDPADGVTYCSHRTTVIVVGGEVVERRFEPLGEPDDPSCEPGFVETGAALGTTPSEIAAPPLPLEGVYAACCEKVLQLEPAEEYKLTFSVDDNGWIEYCYAWPENCEDGCELGPFGGLLRIETLQFGLPE